MRPSHQIQELTDDGRIRKISRSLWQTKLPVKGKLVCKHGKRASAVNSKSNSDRVEYKASQISKLALLHPCIDTE